MNWALSIHPEMWDDANDAIGHYVQIEKDLPRRFTDELRASFVFVRSWPLAGRGFHGGFLRVALNASRTPYATGSPMTRRAPPPGSAAQPVGVVVAVRVS